MHLFDQKFFRRQNPEPVRMLRIIRIIIIWRKYKPKKIHPELRVGLFGFRELGVVQKN